MDSVGAPGSPARTARLRVCSRWYRSRILSQLHVEFGQPAPTKELTVFTIRPQRGRRVDLRISRRFSIRVDARDDVTGRAVWTASWAEITCLPMLGVALHY